jgi:hypothetical protein
MMILGDGADEEKHIKLNLKGMLALRGIADQIRRIPELAAEFYANGGPGVGQAVVGDRFQGKGNSRFAPLSFEYAMAKSKQAKALNKYQKTTFGRSSKLIDVGFRSTTGVVTGFGSSKNLPILVRTGKLRAAVTARGHYVSSVKGMKDVAYVTFVDLPDYALYHHEPKGGRVRRSPVAANLDDMDRLAEFTRRRITMLTARFSGNTTITYGDAQARLIF